MAKASQKVALEGIKFFAYHGFYEEEQRIGSNFIVDVETEQNKFSGYTERLEDTINYERLYAIVAEHMAKPQKLIESVAYTILKAIEQEFQHLKCIRVKVYKLNPPLPGQVDKSLVELSLDL